ncbi:protein MOTHER of FT and TF 1 [Dorcoceras hygrometricum]|uniref:Protein MOTHER of FT and TF 1 n=1 Tax=Dorcoceras hygrometricum TaxID=472368 RepID=A0A2Z7CJM4_9LAMI|nr:protein MOTHER of FT and TF 1 [Dorcoceras hygrometricum]
MATNVDPLVVGRVIGDVVDMFVPTVNMSVYYGSKHVTNGCDIKPSMAAAPPRVLISGLPTDFYTLVMTDPDAPSPRKEILPYNGPRPPVGIHRYILVLFRQKASMSALEPPVCRSHFNTRAFAQYFDLGMPVATVYFNAHKEPANRKR